MKLIAKVVLALTLATAAYGAQDVVSAVHGTIDKIDSGTKTVIVKTTDGTRLSLHLLDRTAIHGADLFRRGVEGFLAWPERRRRGGCSLHKTWK